MLAMSRRPTATSDPASAPSTSNTVFRPSGSFRVVTTPRGLLSATIRHARSARGLAGDLYARRFGDDQGSRISDYLVGDADAPVANQLPRLAARSEAEFRQGAVESDPRHLLKSVA